MLHDTDWALRMEAAAELAPEIECLEGQLRIAKAEAEKWRRLHHLGTRALIAACCVLLVSIACEIAALLYMHGRCS
jgi:hypothetical protein